MLLLIAGWITYRKLPKELLPDIQLPVIYVLLTLEGISPEDAERLLVAADGAAGRTSRA